MNLSWSLALSASFVSSTLLAKGRPSSSNWGSPRVRGEISSSLLPEASGLAQSKADRNRLYHVNDAGSTPSFVVTEIDGRNPQRIDLNIDSVTDTEDLAVGACPDEGSCLYIADIGDNKFRRPKVTLHIVRDTASIQSAVTPAFSVDLTYDDGEAHNAESFAIHPSGYAYILTKETPAQLYRFPVRDVLKKTTIELEKMATLDLTTWLSGTDKPKKIIPTSMDIRPDGKQLVILTRAAGISIDVDLQAALGAGVVDLNKLIAEENIHAERLPMIQLPQSEAVTYLDGGTGILYSSEIVETGGSSAPLVEVSLRR